MDNLNLDLQWIYDDGHGWLRVNRLAYEIGPFRASKYSYLDDEYVYLEEDMDAPLYLKGILGDSNNYRLNNIQYPHIPVKNVSGLSEIRNLNSISKEGTKNE